MRETDQVIPEGEVPAEIKHVNEFLNTLDLETFGDNAEKTEDERDELLTTARLRDWLVGRRLLPQGATVTESDRQLAVELRTVLRAAAEVNGRETPANAANRAATERFPLVLRLNAAGQPELSSRTTGDVQGALGRLVADVATAAATGTWARLKICGAPDCRWAYYDHSKSRTGRWCAMRTCGNRHKTRRYRSRRRDDH